VLKQVTLKVIYFVAFNLPLSPSGRPPSAESGDGPKRPSSANAISSMAANNHRGDYNGTYASAAALTYDDHSASNSASSAFQPRSTSAGSVRPLEFAAGSKRDLQFGGSARKPKAQFSFGGIPVKSPDSVEIERKYQEIMKQCGILSIGNQVS
jgi:hypothetical protein